MSDDDELRAAYARIVEAREPRARDGCLTPEALLAVVEQKGSEAERLRALNHAMSCAACRRELDLLRAVRTVGVAHSTVTRRAIPFVIAASVLVAVGIALSDFARRNPSDRFRGNDDVTVVSPRGETPAAQTLALVWRSVPGATTYDISLLADDGTRVVQRVTTDTTLSLAGTPLHPGTEYTWTVVARAADETQRRSAPARFRVIPR